jgi:copper chaperone CopZ
MRATINGADPAVRTVSGLELPRTEMLEADVDPATACPVCGHRGRRVIALTVTAHLRPEYWSALGDGFWFCWTRECPIFYYDNARRIYVSKEPREVRSRFGLKELEGPRPICYCLGVNAERIFDEVETKGCCDSLEDVERYTRAGTGKWCVTTNPSGVCCRAYLKELVAESLTRASAVARPPVEQVAERLRADDIPGVPLELKVGGMDCEACGVAVAGLIEHAGGRQVRVSFPDGRAQLEWATGSDLPKLLRELTEAGYPTEVTTE